MSETAASRITTISRVYLIIALFVALIFCLILLIQIQMDALIAVRAYVGGEGLWAKAQKDAVRSLEHYAIARDEADYQSYRRFVQVPLGDLKARLELQKPDPDLDIAREGFLQGRNHPVDIERMITFFRRFQHIAYMIRAIGHWTAADQHIAELNGVAEKLHDEITSGRDKPEAVRALLTRLDSINLQVTVEEDLFSSTLAEASRWANDVSRKLTYAIALLFVALGVGVSWTIIIRIRTTENTLFESEERLRSIFEHVDDIIFTVESDGTFSSISPSSERMTGWSPDELISHPFSLFIQPDDLPYMQDLFMKAKAGESLPVFQVRILTKAGGYLESEIVANQVHRGGSVTILGVVRDITERKQAHAEIEFKNTILQTQQEISLDAILVVNENGKIISYNQQFIDLWRISPQVISTHLDAPVLQSVIDQIENSEAFVARVQYLYEHRDDKSREEIRLKDGRIIDRYSAPITGADGKYYGRVWYFRDITERKKSEDALRVAAATFDMHEAIMITDANANILRVNLAFEETTGYRAEEVLGKNPRILSSGRKDKAFYAEMWRQLLEFGSWTGEMWDRRKNGQVYPKWLTITAVKNERGETTEYVALFSDITARKQADEKIRNMAFYDALTKLPNRRLLLDRFRLALSVSARSRRYGAVLFLDMDKFKVLNDTLGHDYGDMLLIDVAQRIQFCVREVDTVARLGGDEFVVLIEEIGNDAEEASRRFALIAEKIRVALAAPYQLTDHQHHSSPSIGVCLYCGNEESVDTLLKHADVAMYQAKNSGRNAVRFFDPAMQLVVETHAALEADLHHAVPDQQLRLYYQIQLDNDSRPLGAEALVRWMHPERGMVSPMQFIPVAEESSLILDIGNWVLDTACRQLALWGKREQTRDLVLAVNVSAQQFSRHDFVGNVAEVVRAHQVNTARLKLELTESVVLNDVADIVAKMHALKALGIKLSLDDFGTGYSSLSYLKQLPLDQLKIDQSFVRDIATDPSDAVMVQTIIGLAQNFGLDVIAEGVETDEQLDFLKQNGCMAYQGYLFSKPVPIEEFEVLLGRV